MNETVRMDVMDKATVDALLSLVENKEALLSLANKATELLETLEDNDG